MALAKPPIREVSSKMKLNHSSKKTGGYLLAFFLLFGILVTVASSTAQAQYRDRYDRYGYRDRDRSRERQDPE